MLIRRALDHGPEMPHANADRFQVELGRKTCFLDDTDEFRFIQLLIARRNTNVSYLDISGLVMGEGASDDTIRSLKRRVCLKLENCAMANLADAIKPMKKHYVFKWPPQSN